jgi:acetyl-CoA carboxylase biotin carboxylase subunit
MAAAAVRGARAVGYIGAGTFEFLVDTDGAFWFIEANCRLQVEHPITEMVTGLDLVRAQLEIASGQRLGLRQEDIRPTGVAIECRVNAESPELGFAPTPGRLDEFVPPGGPFVRVDTHMQPGAAIPAEYDSLLAKVVAWAPDRASAIARMDRALAELRISGPRVSTTTSFLREILAHPLFADSKHTVSLVDQVLAADSPASAGH